MKLPKNKTQLKKQLLEWKKEKSSMPYPKPEQLPETCGKDIENIIKKHCRMLAERWELPISCSVIDVNGTYIPGYGFAANNSTKGVGDVHITWKGQAHWVEVKYGKDTQKPDQKKFQAREERAGATYTIVKTSGDWFNFLKNLIEND